MIAVIRYFAHLYVTLYRLAIDEFEHRPANLPIIDAKKAS